MTSAASSPSVRSSPSLESLPDDVLLRIISLTGGPGNQVSAAYRLGALSTKFRRLLKEQFLPSITLLSDKCLSSLSLADPNTAFTGAVSIFSSTTAVKELDFGGSPAMLLSKEAVQSLVSVAKLSLTKVSFSYCSVTDEVVSPLLQCPKLTYLSLYNCKEVKGLMFGQKEVKAPLEFLDLSWVHSLCRESVRALARFSTLKHLTLTGVEAVNHHTLSAFTSADVRKSMRTIGLSYCPLHNSALRELLIKMSNLKRVTLAEQSNNLWNTGNFTVEEIRDLQFEFPNVEIVFSTV